MRVLVTGAAGFIGSHVVPALGKLGIDVVCLDTIQGYSPDRLADSIPKVAVDITEKLPWDGVPGSFDCVVHLAAIAAPRLCDENPSQAFDVNVNGTHNVLKFALERGARKIVFASTAHVYGVSPKYLPTPESHSLSPQDTYTVTKILGERLCQLYFENHGLSYTALRLFNAYGPGQMQGYFIPDQIAKAKTGKIELRGSDITKDWIYVDDVVDAFVRTLASDFAGPINIGTGVETDLVSIARVIAQAFKSELTFLRAEKPTRMCADSQRARTTLGWNPAVSLAEGLRRVIESPMRAVA